MVNAKPRHRHYSTFTCSTCKGEWILGFGVYPSVTDVELARDRLQDTLGLMTAAHTLLPLFCRDCREEHCV